MLYHCPVKFDFAMSTAAHCSHSNSCINSLRCMLHTPVPQSVHSQEGLSVPLESSVHRRFSLLPYIKQSCGDSRMHRRFTHHLGLGISMHPFGMLIVVLSSLQSAGQHERSTISAWHAVLLQTDPHSYAWSVKSIST